MNIVLIGYRGSGKTQVGRTLAAALQWTFVDTDELIEKRTGCTIRQIFDRQGEPAFRAAEIQVVAEVAAGDEQVIACGGGVVLNPDNVRALRAAGKVVWLRARPEELFRRTQADAATAERRPNLTASGGLQEVRRVLAARTPLYTKAADVVVDTDGVAVEEAAATVRRELRL
jgi:shikimate kinase